MEKDPVGKNFRRKSGAGKGDKCRVSNFQAYWDAPFWNRKKPDEKPDVKPEDEKENAKHIHPEPKPDDHE